MYRKLDELGRIVIPIEFRNNNKWKHKDKIEIIEYDDEIILRKYKGKKCKKCNIKVYENDNYCSNCGIVLN